MNFFNYVLFLFSKILDIVYQPACGICEKYEKTYLCSKCEKKLNKLQTKHLINIIEKPEYINKHYYLFEYKGIIREKIIEYKFKNQAYLYKTFSQIILRNKNLVNIIKKYDLLIPVPIDKKRKTERGYNQTELIAKEISKNINIKLENKNLIKIKNIPAQSSLSKAQREKNIEGVYKILDNTKIKNKKILIIDDVYTTGSTAKECAKTLKTNGARKVDIITIAKD